MTQKIKNSKRRKFESRAKECFYKFPKWFLHEQNLKKLSSNAKLLYMLIIDRENLSIDNNWQDDKGDIYLYFDQLKAREILGLSKDATTKAFKDLIECGLIEVVRQGQGKPNRIYVLDYEVSEDTLKNINDNKKGASASDTDDTDNHKKNNSTDTDCITDKEECKAKNEKNFKKLRDGDEDTLDLLKKNRVINIKHNQLHKFTDIEKLKKCLSKTSVKQFNYILAMYETESTFNSDSYKNDVSNSYLDKYSDDVYERANKNKYKRITPKSEWTW